MLSLRARLKLVIGDKVGARVDSKEALALVPGDREALLAHAAACEQLDRLGEAIESLSILVSISIGQS